MMHAKPIVIFFPALSAKKPPAKLPEIIARLLTEINTPMNSVVADWVTARDLTRKIIAEPETIELAKFARKTIAKSKK